MPFVERLESAYYQRIVLITADIAHALPMRFRINKLKTRFRSGTTEERIMSLGMLNLFIIVMSISYFPTVFGTLAIEDDGEYVTRILLQEGGGEPTDVARRAFREISEYLSGERRAFDFKIRPDGTDFRKSVWKAISEIPYGETRTYAQIADGAGRREAVRAAGSACGANPIIIVIPCHRVVRSDGSTGNYLYGTWMKESLLRMERGY